jgi:hypothetical protein
MPPKGKLANKKKSGQNKTNKTRKGRGKKGAARARFDPKKAIRVTSDSEDEATGTSTSSSESEVVAPVIATLRRPLEPSVSSDNELKVFAKEKSTAVPEGSLAVLAGQEDPVTTVLAAKFVKYRDLRWFDDSSPAEREGVRQLLELAKGSKLPEVAKAKLKAGFRAIETACGDQFFEGVLLDRAAPAAARIREGERVSVSLSDFLRFKDRATAERIFDVSRTLVALGLVKSSHADAAFRIILRVFEGNRSLSATLSAIELMVGELRGAPVQDFSEVLRSRLFSAASQEIERARPRDAAGSAPKAQ